MDDKDGCRQLLNATDACSVRSPERNRLITALLSAAHNNADI
jgi:hypothetical protein